MNDLTIQELSDVDSIRSQILTIRGVQVMLDRDLALLYGVSTGALNQAVKRNQNRFPERFMFQLSKVEVENLKSQTVIASWGGARSHPYAFTEQGIAMLSSVLRSETAVLVSIRIMDAFVEMRKAIASGELALDFKQKKMLNLRRLWRKGTSYVVQIVEVLAVCGIGRLVRGGSVAVACGGEERHACVFRIFRKDGDSQLPGARETYRHQLRVQLRRLLVA